MKKGIHPENYRTVLFYDSNAKQGFLIRSCAKTNNTMKWEDGNEYLYLCVILHLLPIRFILVKLVKLVTKVVQVNLQAVTVNLAHLNQNRNIQ